MRIHKEFKTEEEKSILIALYSDKYIIADVKRGQWGSEEREDIMRSTAEADGRETEIPSEMIVS